MSSVRVIHQAVNMVICSSSFQTQPLEHQRTRVQDSVLALDEKAGRLQQVARPSKNVSFSLLGSLLGSVRAWIGLLTERKKTTQPTRGARKRTLGVAGFRSRIHSLGRPL